MQLLESLLRIFESTLLLISCLPKSLKESQQQSMRTNFCTSFLQEIFMKNKINTLWRTSFFLVLLFSQPGLGDILGTWLEQSRCAHLLTFTSTDGSPTAGQYDLFSTIGCTGSREYGNFTSDSQNISFNGINPTLPPGYQKREYTCSYEISGDQLRLDCDGNIRKYVRQ